MIEGDFRLGDWVVNPLMNTVVGPEGEAHLEPKAMQVIFRDGAARAKRLEGDWQTARDIYRELVRPDIGQKWIAVREPRFSLELARLERESGNAAEASRHYREFLEFWSRADPSLPEVVEAKTYLASS